MNNAQELAHKTRDAYSVQRYTSWTACASVLMKRGYSEQETEAILRSKWMRWAADCSEKLDGKVTSKDMARFLDDPRNKCTKENVTRLVAGTS